MSQGAAGAGGARTEDAARVGRCRGCVVPAGTPTSLTVDDHTFIVESLSVFWGWSRPKYPFFVGRERWEREGGFSLEARRHR